MNRTIFHIDVNSAFLSWEATKRLQEGDTLDLRTIPSAVCGDAKKRHGVILAKSIPAGKCGVRTGESINEALRKCPELMLVDSSFQLYRKCSNSFINIIREYTPIIEQVSIDETFADMTGCYNEEEGAVAFATRIKERIKAELGFTVNIGISDAVILAKMASDFEKPDKVHTLYTHEIKRKMWPLPVENLMYVGKSTASKLRTLGIRTIGELACFDYDLLKQHFGKMATSMHEYANGIDESEVNPVHEEAKCCGNSTTIDHDVTDSAEAKKVLLSLCESVGSRLRKENFFAGTISVTIKNNLLKKNSHQRVLKNVTNVTMVLYENACDLFDEMWDGETPIRLLGVSTSDLSHESNYQYSLFDYGDITEVPKISCSQEKKQRADKAMDDLKKRFGDSIVTRASLLHRNED